LQLASTKCWTAEVTLRYIRSMIAPILFVAVGYALLRTRPWSNESAGVRQVQPMRSPTLRDETDIDPTTARIRAYWALSMVERYGEYGPP
jgi:hypothetical protein